MGKRPFSITSNRKRPFSNTSIANGRFQHTQHKRPFTTHPTQTAVYPSHPTANAVTKNMSVCYTCSMKVYLDTCSIQRPLDNKTQMRIVLEADAMLGIINLCNDGYIELVSSDVLLYEVKRNPKIMRREFGLDVLSNATEFINLDAVIEQQAKQFEKTGIKPLDALHLASAEKAGADYFCTCDDRFLKKAKRIVSLQTKAVTPLELIQELENDD